MIKTTFHHFTRAHPSQENNNSKTKMGRNVNQYKSYNKVVGCLEIEFSLFNDISIKSKIIRSCSVKIL